MTDGDSFDLRMESLCDNMCKSFAVATVFHRCCNIDLDRRLQKARLGHGWGGRCTILPWPMWRKKNNVRLNSSRRKFSEIENSSSSSGSRLWLQRCLCPGLVLLRVPQLHRRGRILQLRDVHDREPLR